MPLHPVGHAGAGLTMLQAANLTSVAQWTGSEMMIFGGYTLKSNGSQGSYNSDIHAFNPSSNTWRTIASPLSGRISHSVLWVNNKLIVWGGKWQEVLATSDVNETTLTDGGMYDPNSGWTVMDPDDPNMPANNSQFFFPVAAEDIMYLFCSYGRIGGIFNPASGPKGKWEKMNMTDAPYNIDYAHYIGDQKILVLSHVSKHINLYEYNIALNTWEKLSPTGPAPKPFLLEHVTYSNGKLFAWDTSTIGGFYSPQTNQWTLTKSSSHVERAGATTIGTNDGAMIFGGGFREYAVEPFRPDQFYRGVTTFKVP